ncbi:MAG: tetratricopeptide (TPR) repeat protein [Verrucomicrobiales bacterium]|jgi:tetratricopeptide (TPR) repeat protein
MNRLVLIFGVLIPFFAVAVEQEELQKIHQAFHAGLEHEQKGEIAEALQAYLSTPGGEHAAARLARKFPDIAKKTIKGLDGNGTRIRVRLIEAELHLVVGETDEALASFRAYREEIGSGVPADYYPVETTPVGGGPPGFSGAAGHWTQPALPFELGPGSHVDNWLIRRFIALEAWEDAAAEFTRIQGIHDRHDRIDPLTLQFALDHAFFMLERDREDEALDLLSRQITELDLDHRLGIPGDNFEHGCPWIPRGISHDEFIRLALGAFKKGDRKDELIASIQGQIESGTNEGRRVLAKLRLHEGALDAALKLELDFIKMGEFSPVSAAIRRGQVFEAFDKHADAAEAFENALKLAPEQKIDLPKDGFVPQTAFFSQQAGSSVFRPDNSAAAGRYRRMVLEKLEAAYSALGEPDMVLKTKLLTWGEDPGKANSFGAVASLAQLAKSTGLEAEFTRWADAARSNVEKFSAQSRSNLHWIRGDVAGTLGAIQELAKGSEYPIMDFHGWLERFSAADQAQQLLEVLVAASPEIGRYRLELLNLSGDDASPELLVEQYETLLAPDAQPAFSRGKGSYNRTQFENYFDLAHRLMRLYVRTGQREKMEELGLRMIRGVKPFPKPDRWNDHGHDKRAAAYLISQAGEKTLGALAVVLDGENWRGSAGAARLDARWRGEGDDRKS